MTYEVRHRLSQLHTFGRCMLVAITSSVALAVALPLGLALSGMNGVWASIAASATVLASSIAGLLAADLFRGPTEAMFSLLVAMALRMSLPLAACMLVLVVGGPLASGGYVFFVLAFYLVALPTETLLAVSKISQDSKA